MNITFETTDSLKDTAVKTLQIYAGSSALKNEMKKLGVDYVKTQRGLFIIYILRHPEFGRITVKL